MRVSKECGEAITQLLAGDSYGQASIRTGISRGYWVDILKGKVPSAEALTRILDGYRERLTTEEAQRIFNLAGYPIPDEWRATPEPLEATLKFLKNTEVLPQYSLDQLRELVAKIRSEE